MEKNKYDYEEVMFVVNAAFQTYEKIYNLDLRSKFPMKYKKEIFERFKEKFGELHPFHSVKMLIDNILANWNIEGYRKFGRGSKAVQDAALSVWNDNN